MSDGTKLISDKNLEQVMDYLTNQIYNNDIQSIKNLGIVSKKLQE